MVSNTAGDSSFLAFSMSKHSRQNRMKRFLTWLTDRMTKETVPSPTRPPNPLRSMPKAAPRRPPAPAPAKAQDFEFAGEIEGKIIDGGPGKNVLVRNKYVREDTGTHDTLQIMDESLLRSPDDDGIDPYNTGRFDRSKSWDSYRTRK